jgi:hypothetical protein
MQYQVEELKNRRAVEASTRHVHMFFTRTDWRSMKFALILALPVEGAALWVFSNVNLSFSPAAPVETGVKAWLDGAVLFIHFPVFLIAPMLNDYGHTTAMWICSFLIGYVDMLLAFGLILVVFRIGHKALGRS